MWQDSMNTLPGFTFAVLSISSSIMEISSAFLATPSAGRSCLCSADSRPTAKPEPKRAPATTRPARLTSTSLTTELFFTFFFGVAANISCGALMVITLAVSVILCG